MVELMRMSREEWDVWTRGSAMRRAGYGADAPRDPLARGRAERAGSRANDSTCPPVVPVAPIRTGRRKTSMRTHRAASTCDARWIDSVWAMSWNGARIGAFETYMDTPYYEQLQYVGDTRIQALISLYVAGDDRLMRQALRHFDDSRLPEGITQSRYPSALMIHRTGVGPGLLDLERRFRFRQRVRPAALSGPHALDVRPQAP